jgi:hypothetical protein
MLQAHRTSKTPPAGLRPDDAEGSKAADHESQQQVQGSFLSTGWYPDGAGRLKQQATSTMALQARYGQGGRCCAACTIIQSLVELSLVELATYR